MPIREDRGWLSNPDRLKRRDQPNTLLDHDVKHLIEKIDSTDEYSKEDSSIDSLLRLRDKAIIAFAWTWFKRGGEDLGVKFGEIFLTEKEIGVMFHIEKKSKSFRLCPFCTERGKPTRNAKKANFCKNCGNDIKAVQISQTHPAPLIKTKRKTLKWPFCKNITEWLEAMKTLNVGQEAYLFAPFFSFRQQFMWERHMTIQRFDQILQRLDPTMTSSFFRYGHTEKLQRMGKSNTEIGVIGDWESDRMPAVYGKRKGITAEETKFAEDVTQL